MRLYSDFRLAKTSKFAEVIVCLVVIALLFGCQSLPNAPVPATSTVEVQISTALPLNQTPVPACVTLPEVELHIDILSENSVHLRITGLMPNEPVFTIFSSKFEEEEKSISCCPGEFADENGVYEYEVGLRSQTFDAEFKEWQVQVVHSRGSLCTEFVLPDKPLPS